MKVRKRNGAVVPFDKKYIFRAIGLAAAAAGEQDEEMEEKTTDMIEQKLLAMQEDIIGIETIQDMVEECLLSSRDSAQPRRIFCTEEKKSIQEKSGSQGFFPENF